MAFNALFLFPLGKTKVGLEIWDTGGQERYHSITDNYYHTANAVLFCYDVSDRSTFTDIGKWVKYVMERLREPGSVKMLLVALKSDLYEGTKVEDRVSAEDGKKKADTMKPPIFFIETSAKEGINVKELFEQVAREVSVVDEAPPDNTIIMDKGNTRKSGSGRGGDGCCKKS